MMTKTIPTDAQQAVLDAIARFPSGVSTEQIEAILATAPNRRTLQRWLIDLIAQGHIHKQGQGRAVKYHLSRTESAAAQIIANPETLTWAETQIPLSPAGREIERLVHQPIVLRHPVGYNQTFLEDYRPNEACYLTQDIRDDLLSHGKTIHSNVPAGTYARQLANRLLIDLSWNSSRLEGNTYSLLETERLLNVGEPASGKNALDAQMILNHKEAIEFLIDAVSDIGFNRYTVLNLHALLSDNLLDDPTASGRLRSIAVGIGQTTFLPLEGPQRIATCFDQVLDTAAAIRDPFEQAFFAMVHLPYLQPFEDVNKRVSRLAANIALIKNNLCPLSFVDVSKDTYISAMLGVYELNRIELLRDVFVWAYKRSCARYSAVRQSLGEPDPFRLRHRQHINQAITDIVRQEMSKSQAIRFIQAFARAQIELDECARFIEVVETQLLSLHGGSIARYRLRPSEFDAWQVKWNTQPR